MAIFAAALNQAPNHRSAPSAPSALALVAVAAQISTVKRASSPSSPTKPRYKRRTKKYNNFNIFFMLEQQLLLQLHGGGIDAVEKPINMSDTPLVKHKELHLPPEVEPSLRL